MFEATGYQSPPAAVSNKYAVRRWRWKIVFRDIDILSDIITIAYRIILFADTCRIIIDIIRE